MTEEKYKTCKHSTGNVGELIVYVKPSCPNSSRIRGTLCSSKMRCRKCDRWDEKHDRQDNG